MRIRPTTIGPCCLLLMAGCTTLTVSKVSPRDQDPPRGLVYSLPKKFLLVEPQPDGTMNVGFRFLPDPENTYAIHARTILANHTLDIQLTEEGFLKTVTWNPDATQAATEAIAAAAALASGELKQRSERKKEKEAAKQKQQEEIQTAFKTALTSAQSTVDTEEGNVKTQQGEVARLESDLRVLEFKLDQQTTRLTALNPGSLTYDTDKAASETAIEETNREIFAKKEEISLARGKLTASEQALAQAQATLQRSRTMGTFGLDPASVFSMLVRGAASPANVPGGALADGTTKEVWGALLYEVQEGQKPKKPQESKKGQASSQPAPGDKDRAQVRLVRVDLQGPKDQDQQGPFDTSAVPTKKPPEFEWKLSIEGSAVLYRPESLPEVRSAKATMDTTDTAYQHHRGLAEPETDPDRKTKLEDKARAAHLEHKLAKQKYERIKKQAEDRPWELIVRSLDQDIENFNEVEDFGLGYLTNEEGNVPGLLSKHIKWLDKRRVLVLIPKLVTLPDSVDESQAPSPGRYYLGLTLSTEAQSTGQDEQADGHAGRVLFEIR